MRGQWSNGQGKQQMSTPPPPPAPPLEKHQPFDIAQNIQGINTSKTDSEEERRSDSYGRVPKIVQHYYPAQSAGPHSSPQHVVEMATKGEFLQNCRPLNTVSLLFQGHPDCHTHHRIRPRNVLHSVVEPVAETMSSTSPTERI